MSKPLSPYPMVLLGALVLSGCPTALPSNQKAPNMPAATPASTSTVSPRSLLTSLTDLILETREVRDITPGRLEATMGQRVDRWSDSHFGFVGAATAEWRYAMEVQHASMHGALADFSFQPATFGTMPAVRPLCDFDYDAMAARLIAAGFQHRTAYAEHGRPLGEHFTRDGLTAMLTVRIAGDAPGAVGPKCVTAVSLR